MSSTIVNLDPDPKKRQLLADQLDALYRKIPKIACQRKCQGYCGPIALSLVEFMRLEAVAEIPATMGLSCPLLAADGSCSQYALRPLICRLWGVIPQLPCEFGCLPERVMTEREVGQLFRQVSEISMALSGVRDHELNHVVIADPVDLLIVRDFAKQEGRKATTAPSPPAPKQP